MASFLYTKSNMRLASSAVLPKGFVQIEQFFKFGSIRVQLLHVDDWVGI